MSSTMRPLPGTQTLGKAKAAFAVAFAGSLFAQLGLSETLFLGLDGDAAPDLATAAAGLLSLTWYAVAQIFASSFAVGTLAGFAAWLKANFVPAEDLARAGQIAETYLATSGPGLDRKPDPEPRRRPSIDCRPAAVLAAVAVALIVTGCSTTKDGHKDYPGYFVPVEGSSQRAFRAGCRIIYLLMIPEAYVNDVPDPQPALVSVSRRAAEVSSGAIKAVVEYGRNGGGASDAALQGVMAAASELRLTLDTEFDLPDGPIEIVKRLAKLGSRGAVLWGNMRAERQGCNDQLRAMQAEDRDPTAGEWEMLGTKADVLRTSIAAAGSA